MIERQKERQKLIQLGKDILRDNLGTRPDGTRYSMDEANSVFVEKIKEITGDSLIVNPRIMGSYNLEAFAILVEVVSETVNEGIEGMFSEFVDIRRPKFGDQEVFKINDRLTYRIDRIAGGTVNLDRQRLAGERSYTIPTDWYGASVYEEWELLASGKRTLAGVAESLRKSFSEGISNMVYSTLHSSFTSLTAPFSVAGQFDEEQFLTLIEHVTAATGATPIVMGTRLGLNKVVPNNNFISDEMRNNRNQTGFFQRLDGINLVQMPQRHKVGTYDFAIDNDLLLVIPNTPERIIKLVLEGDMVLDNRGYSNAGFDNQDMTSTITTLWKMGAGVLQVGKAGAYILQP